MATFTKTEISQDQTWHANLFGPLGVIMFGVAIFHDFIFNEYALKNIIVPAAASIVFLIITYLSYYSKSVYFDSSYMYIEGRSFSKRIPLKNIETINQSMFEINEKHLWRISYINLHKATSSISILPRHKALEVFKQKVNAAKAEVAFNR